MSDAICPVTGDVDCADRNCELHYMGAPIRLQCAWFALCRNVATGTKSHPIIGEVPICDRCRAKSERD